MTIINIDEKEILNQATPKYRREAIFFYTTLCGTCKLGERMLEIIEGMDKHIPIRKMNINYCPILRDAWKITSVPCLVILKNGEPDQFVYAMRSVDYLYGLLKE